VTGPSSEKESMRQSVQSTTSSALIFSCKRRVIVCRLLDKIFVSSQEACPHVSTVIKGSRHSRVRVCCDELLFPRTVSYACREARLTSVRFAEPEKKCTSELPSCLAAEVKCMRFGARTRNASHGFCHR
jgi:hypothetical protein